MSESQTVAHEKQQNNALHFFVYLLVFFSLGFVSFGAGNILFSYINKFFPDTFGVGYASGFDQGSVKFGIAALFIAGPIFFLLMRYVAESLQKGTLAFDSRVRRWITYLALFFAAGTIIGDLITLVVFFLNGDIIVRFLLKVVTILVIAGGIFAYYFWDIRRKKFSSEARRIEKYSGYGSLLAVCIIFISGFFIIDSPSVSRQKNQDARMVENLSVVDASINQYFDNAQQLPNSLTDLKGTKYEPMISAGQNIEYRVTSLLGYELCAQFNQSNKNETSSVPVQIYGPDNNAWVHDAGKVCFQRSAVVKSQK